MTERVFAMPDLGEGLEEGTIVEWLVATGDTVELNQPFVEVETAKAAVEIPSPFVGRIVALHGSVGEAVPVGDPLVTFEVEGPAGSPVRDRSSRLKATPPARKLAKSLGVDLASVRGTGPDGRVTEEDVRSASGLKAAAFTDEPAGDPIRQAVHGRRREIAEVLTRQWAIPQVTTFRTIDCTELQLLRTSLSVSPLPIIIAALVAVVADHPVLNWRWGGDFLERRGVVHVGIAVDADDGLVVPVLKDAASLGVEALAVEIRRLAAAAREGSLQIEDVTGATIAVSNTGSYGSEAGTPILSPGTSVTVAFGVIEDRALVVDGVVVARPAATISLTFDHRVLDGATAGRALTDLVALLQSRERLGELPR
jgi:pyruvate dehydrogenase E2 component (dihydrolipoamide acetyltransferase)